MTTLREAAELALKAIEQGETFGYLENVVAPTLEAALKEAPSMKYEDIKTFKQRCEDRPAHPAEIQLHLHEEIAALRHYIEFNLPKPKPAPFFTWHDLQNNNAP